MTIIKEQAIVHTATEDIIVYKVAIDRVNRYISYYEKYSYMRYSEMRAKYFDDTIDAIRRFYEMEAEKIDLHYGFHSFVKLEDARHFFDNETDEIKGGSRQHSYYYANPKLIVLKFVVPAGSQYIRGTFTYFDNYENILSEKLKFIGVAE